MGCHHKLEDYLDAYIAAAGIADDDRRGDEMSLSEIERVGI